MYLISQIINDYDYIMIFFTRHCPNYFLVVEVVVTVVFGRP